MPGFRKDQVRVQVDNHGVLRATGERSKGGGQWARFMKQWRTWHDAWVFTGIPNFLTQQ